MKKKQNGNLQNRKAKFDYALEDSFLAGLVLSGPEVRSIRDGRVSLKGAFVTVRDGELWLNNMLVTATSSNKAHFKESESSRPRKLLLKEKEIATLIAAKQQGKSIVATDLLRKKFIKVRISTGTGKKSYDKRETIKRREQNIEARRAISSRG